MTFTIDEIIVPDDPRPGDVVDGVRHVRTTVQATTLGTDVFALDLPGTAMLLRDGPGRRRRSLVARADGFVIGCATLMWPTVDGAEEVDIEVDVLPDHRRQGVGEALLKGVELWAAELGRTSWQAHQIPDPTVAGERLPSRTGLGGVPADDPGVRFLVKNGYELELVARLSLLAMDGRIEEPGSPGDEYGVVAWSGATPSEWADDIAALKAAMYTDTPMAAMVLSSDLWDADRVRARDARMIAGGRLLLTAAVEHRPSGRLVAFTELDVAAAGGGAGRQADTLVAREHRGHGLGLLAKRANLRQLREVSPATPAVATFNAEDNTPMIAVNDALGFRPIGVEGSWRRAVGVDWE